MACVLVVLQALVVSHNDEPPFSWQPYLRRALRPLNPAVLVGVTGKSTEAPDLPAKYGPFQAWKDRELFWLRSRVSESIVPCPFFELLRE